MMLFIEEVLQVLAIEIAGVGCGPALIDAYWKCMVRSK